MGFENNLITTIFSSSIMSSVLWNDQLFDFSSHKFNVSGGIVDNEPPKLVSLEFERRRIRAPHNLKVKIHATDDASGVNYVSIGIVRDVNGKYENVPSATSPFFCKQTIKVLEYICEGNIHISQFFSEGKYIVSRVELYDKAGRIGRYAIETEDFNNGEIRLDKEYSFEVFDVFRYDLITSTTDKELVSKIKNAQDGANIAINSMIDSIVKKEVFEAIKNTTKTIFIEASGITWVFNGKDITNPKDIDTKVIIALLHDDKLKDEFEEVFEKAIVINFAKNGSLPGKSLVRIKADYVFADYIGENDLFVFHYNGNKKFNAVANSIDLTDDGYYEFYINRNSEFIITNEKPDDAFITEDDSMLLLNEIAEIDKSGEGKVKKYIIIVVGIIIGTALGIFIIIKRKIIFRRFLFVNTEKED